jgi:hypothetical protein
MSREPDMIAMALADALARLNDTRLMLSVALELAHDLTMENRRQKDRIDALIDDLRALQDERKIEPEEIFRRW